ncbi:MAG: efflux RND transporter permease subunit [Mailhella sp.]|nr:efflux RND transporter permease subunit [Mailhella sp.]
MSRFFIHHPIFAWVLAIVTMLFGVLAIYTLPISQYPEVAAPSIRIHTRYAGASPGTVDTTVTQVIEQNLTGIDNLVYMRSKSDSAGMTTINLTFEVGTNPDVAHMQVQNKVQQVLSQLPSAVQAQGVEVAKGNDNMFMVISLYSPDHSLQGIDLADYMSTSIKDEISRTKGVGTVQVFGGKYVMRIWLDSDRMTKYRLTPSDVRAAVQSQNAEVSAGQMGANQIGAKNDQALNVIIKAQSLLTTISDFESILLKVTESGERVYVRDVARVAVGSEMEGIEVWYNGHPATGIGVTLAPSANGLETANLVKAKMEELSRYFPDGMAYDLAFDTTPPVVASIQEVIKTLLEAIALVFIVMLIFLQSLRATIIPTIAVPVVLLGTFGVLLTFGYSINTLTLFAMVLAIGLLVDDAIVVVENVERLIEEEHLPPMEATEKSMDQISSSLIGIGVVLSAVFLPMAFMSGSTGVIYRQFSVTIVSSMTLSVLVALILTPSLCASLLKKHTQSAQGGFFGIFNRVFTISQRGYAKAVHGCSRRGWRLMVVYVSLIAILGLVYRQLPSSFLPTEDQGSIITMLQMPPNSTMAQTKAQFKQVADYVLNEEKDIVESYMFVAGYSMAGVSESGGMGFIKLKDYKYRKNPGQDAASVAMRVRQRFGGILNGMFIAAIPPAIISLGMTNVFTLELQDRGGAGHDALRAAGQRLMGASFANPLIAYIRPTGMDDQSQFNIHLDNAKATSMGLTLAAVNADVSTMLGGAYVNDFVHHERVKKVFIQGDADVNRTPSSIDRIQFRNNRGEMVPFSAVFSTDWSFGPNVLERYNATPALEYQGEPVPGIASGVAMSIMEEEVRKLGKDFGMEWTGLSYQEKLAGSQTTMLYALSVLVVFLALAALYESWSIPFAVLMVIPLGILGAVCGTWARDLTNDVYFQVGLLAVMGLSSKNAILIVEFARTLREEGRTLLEATVEACRLRLRPILMTSFAFGLGVLPMMSATGAGSASQHAVGTCVFWGTVVATMLGIFFIPVFFVLICSSVDSIGRILKKKTRYE